MNTDGTVEFLSTDSVQAGESALRQGSVLADGAQTAVLGPQSLKIKALTSDNRDYVTYGVTGLADGFALRLSA